ncbi:MAG: proline dehydrogenase [Bacteroidetes bacterium]|jgi:proline dehydrogenase|nr:proline dehydrogenase [Bacteroidota bacterium]MBT4412225.1 proline dehydrogenase [Bacteroidota bacterium]MBT5425400.1 proline dehydrogenase [Bacteroidota bacterium]MBT7095087.1 proline dehydrogenase [Bacteroidota bacterium]MBT7464494.1 proline dehydrogenase [Bacteroidota bacterium]
MHDFDNTQIAFEYKSKYELKKALLLFKMVGSSLLVKISKVLVNIALALRIPVAWAIKPTIYAHFCGGESIDESMPVVRKLEPFKIRAILDYSVEGKESDEDIRAALNETLETIRSGGTDTNIPFAVFKPTAFTTAEVLEKMSTGAEVTDQRILAEANKFRERVNTLCQEAYNHNIPILIDAEDSWYQLFIDQVCEDMMLKYNHKQAIVYNTLQMYRTDRLEYLEEAHERAIKGNYFMGIKFVRGAYMEKERERAEKMSYPDPINPTKEATDKMYDDGLRYTMEHLDRISVFNGSHNEASNHLLTQLIEEKGLERSDSRIWFSQLFGMSDNISFNLASEGYNVAKYLPFGPVKHVLPYLIRRAEENTAVAGQTSRELELIKQELNRRKKEK